MEIPIERIRDKIKEIRGTRIEGVNVIVLEDGTKLYNTYDKIFDDPKEVMNYYTDKFVKAVKSCIVSTRERDLNKFAECIRKRVEA